MSDRFTGFRQFDLPEQYINQLHTEGVIDVWDGRLGLHNNLYVELRNIANTKQTALTRTVDNGKRLERIKSIKATTIEPRNREQVYAMDALMRDEIPVVLLTGTAGTGKTLLALAMAVAKMESSLYDKVLITRPMSEVGRYKLGALPGDIEEKFGPYLLNYMTNMEQFVGDKRVVQDLMRHNRFEIVPLQLIRGASFNNCLVIADEMQVCDHQEILTIGTRIGEHSKLVLMGDLNQRDEKIARDKTGLHKFFHDRQTKESNLVAAIELQRCERSATARLFAKVFEA